MMEFILSKVALCMCGVVLMAVAVSVIDDTGEDMEKDGMMELSETIARILDEFWHSGLDSMVLPESTVPYPGCTVTVRDNLVSVGHDGTSWDSVTEYPGCLTMGFGMCQEVTRRTSRRS